MLRTHLVHAGLATLLACSPTATAEDGKLGQLFEENSVAAQNTQAAFECAALAFRFDHKEYERLLHFAYTQGQEFMPAMFTALLNEEGEVDLESVPWEETPYKDLRELIAFQLGKMYGKIEEGFFRDIPYGESAETWEAAHMREYESRNCSVIGQ